MFKDRRRLREYVIDPGTSGISVGSAIDTYTKGNLQFNFSLLPQTTDAHSGVEIIDITGGGGKRYIYGGSVFHNNVNYMTTSLDLGPKGYEKDLVTPDQIKQDTRSVLFDDMINQNFAGYTEYFYWYRRKGDSHDRLEQRVAVTRIPESISLLVDRISIIRVAKNHVVEQIYGFVGLKTPEIPDRLGMSLPDGASVSLAFVPNKVLGINYDDVGANEVIAETAYDKLEGAGIKARFINEEDKAVLALAIGNISFKLSLGKVLKPNYPDLLFSESGEWITDSGIYVGQIPQQMLS